MKVSKIKISKEPEDVEELKKVLYTVVGKFNTLVERYNEDRDKYFDEFNRITRMDTLRKKSLIKLQNDVEKLDRDRKDVWSYIHSLEEKFKKL